MNFTDILSLAHNVMLARLATKRAKPNGQFHVSNDKVCIIILIFLLQFPNFVILKSVGCGFMFNKTNDSWILCWKARQYWSYPELGQLLLKS